jgi:hypothetical protein
MGENTQNAKADYANLKESQGKWGFKKWLTSSKDERKDRYGSRQAAVKDVSAAASADLQQARDARAETKAAEATDKANAEVTAELAKFSRLRDQGVITAEDFEAKKRQILGL